MNNISLRHLNEAISSYNDFDLYANSIILAWRGSISHGTYIPKHIDDKDLMGVVIPPIEYYFGLKNFGNKNSKTIYYNEWDIVFYELRKFVKLLLNSNPNVLSLLWLKKEYYINTNEYGDRLIENRDKFISKKIYKTFAGYAYSQLKRMEHYKFEGYMGKKRKELVNKFGYDSKNAGHLIRLLRMGIEALETGQINVYREKDRDQLIQIKRGEWKLEKIKKYSDILFKKLETAMDNTKLREYPDYDFAERFLIETLESHFKL